jgi:hypothetical protein
VARHPYDYAGNPWNTLPSSITPRIATLEFGGIYPLPIMCHAFGTQSAGGQVSSYRVASVPYADAQLDEEDLAFRWTQTPRGTRTWTHPGTGRVWQPDAHQTCGLFYSVLESAGQYRIGLRAGARLRDGSDEIWAGTSRLHRNQMQAVFIPATGESNAGTFAGGYGPPAGTYKLGMLYNGTTTWTPDITSGSTDSTPKLTRPATVIGYLEALPGIGTGNVRLVSQSEVGVGAFLMVVEFTGALSGTTLPLLQINTAGLTGTRVDHIAVMEYQAAGTADYIDVIAPTTTLYFDSVAGSDANPGTEALPKQTWTAIKAAIETNRTEPRHLRLKYGSSWTGLPNPGAKLCGTSGTTTPIGPTKYLRLGMPWGTPGDGLPEIVASTPVLQFDLDYGADYIGDNLIGVEDVYAVGVEINGGYLIQGGIKYNAQTTGKTGIASRDFPFKRARGIGVIDCKMVSVGIGFSGEATGTVGAYVIGCDVDSPSGIAVGTNDFMSYTAIVETKIRAGPGSETLDHFIYQKCVFASLFRYLDLQSDADSKISFALNLNTQDIYGTPSTGTVIDCVVAWTKDGIDFSDKANTTAEAGTYGFGYGFVVQDVDMRVSQTLATSSTGVGFFCYGAKHTTVRDCDITDGKNGANYFAQMYSEVSKTRFIRNRFYKSDSVLPSNNIITGQLTSGAIYWQGNEIVAVHSQTNRNILGYDTAPGGVPAYPGSQLFHDNKFYDPLRAATTFGGRTLAQVQAIPALLTDTTNTLFSSDPYPDPLTGDWGDADITDVTAPTQPGVIVFSAVTSTGFTATWPVSTDAVGVTAYQLILNGVPLADVATNTVALTGLVPGVSYTLSVRGKDAEGNVGPERLGTQATDQPTIVILGGSESDEMALGMW